MRFRVCFFVAYGALGLLMTHLICHRAANLESMYHWIDMVAAVLSTAVVSLSPWCQAHTDLRRVLLLGMTSGATQAVTYALAVSEILPGQPTSSPRARRASCRLHDILPSHRPAAPAGD